MNHRDGGSLDRSLEIISLGSGLTSHRGEHGDHQERLPCRSKASRILHGFRLAGGHLNGMLARATRIPEKDRQRGRKTGSSTCLPIKGVHSSVSDLAGPAGIPEVGKKGTIQQARSWEPEFCAQPARMEDETDVTRCSPPQLTSRPVISKRSTRRRRLQQAWMSSPPSPHGGAVAAKASRLLLAASATDHRPVHWTAPP